MKARGHRPSAFIASRSLEPLMKHEARVFWYSLLNELPTIIVCSYSLVLLNNSYRIVIKMVWMECAI